MTEWVLGLSIDEDVSLAAARVELSQAHRQQWHFVKPTPEHFLTLIPPHEVNNQFSLHDTLRNIIFELKHSSLYGPIFEAVRSIGISTIGLANRKTLKLTSIARKNWVEGDDDYSSTSGCVVDFSNLFDQSTFPRLGRYTQERDKEKSHTRYINLSNDATAKCVSEYYSQNPDKSVEQLFYIMISEGVNGGFVNNGWPYLSQLHPEMGHIWPKLHPVDYLFNSKHTGCPIHKVCFEGVASGARIRKSWNNRNLKELRADGPNSPDHPWHIIAYYTAQLCMDAALSVAPERILLGGHVIFQELIPIVRAHFNLLNHAGSKDRNGRHRNYLKYDAMDTHFIQAARVRKHEGIRGALQLARLTLENHTLALGTAAIGRFRPRPIAGLRPKA